MKILAMDSSALVASVAVLEDDNLIAEYTVNYKKTHSQTLMGMLDEIVKMTELDLSGIDVIAVAKGPGSFTGLRIGSASAKGLAMALDKDIVAVPTVDAMAYGMWGCHDLICPIMDARREQVYTGLYTFDNEMKFNVLMPQCAIGIAELAEFINKENQRVVLLGDAVAPYGKKLSAMLQVPTSFAPASVNKQRAAAVGTLALEYAKNGDIQSAAEHVPVYLRQSQAEREFGNGKND